MFALLILHWHRFCCTYTYDQRSFVSLCHVLLHDCSAVTLEGAALSSDEEQSPALGHTGSIEEREGCSLNTKPNFFTHRSLKYFSCTCKWNSQTRKSWFKYVKVSSEMARSYVLFFLLAGCSLAQENKQTLNTSRECEEDTSTFLREINQSSPREYALTSKCLCLLKALSYVHVRSDWCPGLNPGGKIPI